MVELTLDIIKILHHSFLLSDGDKSDWFPKSKIEYDDDLEPGDTGVFRIPEWLATKKGFV